MRETLRVEASTIHWMEKIGYRIIFAAEGIENEVIEDVSQYLDRMVKSYERETYKIRLRAHEIEAKGKIWVGVVNINRIFSENKVCASIMSSNLLCEKTSNGISCNECHFKAIIADCSRWVNEMNSDFGNRAEQKAKLEKAELRFDDAVELISEKCYKVNWVTHEMISNDYLAKNWELGEAGRFGN